MNDVQYSIALAQLRSLRNYIKANEPDGYLLNTLNAQVSYLETKQAVGARCEVMLRPLQPETPALES